MLEAIVQERDQVHQQLRSSMEEIEKERKMKEELLERLQALQGKVMPVTVE